jgi:hypothetical protein
VGIVDCELSETTDDLILPCRDKVKQYKSKQLASVLQTFATTCMENMLLLVMNSIVSSSSSSFLENIERVPILQ